MNKVKIKMITLRHLPINFNQRKIEKWGSQIFEISLPIENIALCSDSDCYGWEYSDQILEEEIPENFEGDFLFAILNVPLQDNWYSRRLSGNRVVFTFHEIKEFLGSQNIPIENVIIYLLYSYTLAYKSFGNRFPQVSEQKDFTHDETRGCLFDMHGIKSDVVYSCNKPIICSECFGKLRSRKISAEVLNRAQKEIKKIKKELFYRIRDFVEVHPLLSLAITSLFAILLGIVGSLTASFIWEKHLRIILIQ